MKGVEEVKYMRGDENRVNARNQENLVRETHKHTHAHTPTHLLTACHPRTHSDLFLTVYQLKRTGSCLCPEAAPPASQRHTHLLCLAQTHKEVPHTRR